MTGTPSSDGLRVGHTYRDKNNHLVKIAFRNPEGKDLDSDHPFVGFNKNTGTWTSYTEGGHYDKWSPADEDLVEEVGEEDPGVVRYDSIDPGGVTILAYALFHSSKYEPCLGRSALVAGANTIEALKALPEVAECDAFSSWQIIDTSDFEITDAGDADGPTIVDSNFV